MGQLFLGGLSHLYPKIFLTAPEKTAMLTCKITLPDSPHPVIISKNPGFRALYLARRGMNSVLLFNKYRKYFISFLAAGFCPKNLAFARKMMAVPESVGGSPPPPGPLARTPMMTGD